MHRSSVLKIKYGPAIIILLFAGLFLLLAIQYQQIRLLRTDLNTLARDGINPMGASQPISQTPDIELCSISQQTVNRQLEIISQSICLIQGEYLFVNREGNYVSWNDLNGVVPSSSFVMNQTDDSQYVNIQYTGSGFLVDSRGYIITNKHVALPWVQANRDRMIIDAGFRPRMVMFRAFFPGIEQPFELEFVTCSPDDDIAILKILKSHCPVPVLKCAYDTEYYVGMPVTILGYPTGFDLLTARISHDDFNLVNSSFDNLAIELASQKLIKPMATSGICGQVNYGKIAYDAATAIGASGAPVLDKNGRVIAVNAALLKGFAGTNFGVPIARVKALLETIE